MSLLVFPGGQRSEFKALAGGGWTEESSRCQGNSYFFLQIHNNIPSVEVWPLRKDILFDGKSIVCKEKKAFVSNFRKKINCVFFFLPFFGKKSVL